MTFKIGDRVRRIITDNTKKMLVGSEWVVNGIQPNGYVRVEGFNFSSNPNWMELITPAPLTLEVGKTYMDAKGNQFLIEGILYISGVVNNTRKYFHPDGKGEFNGISLISEYIPPPPEEWRAVFYREHHKPEISACYYPTKEACERNNTTPTFLYAIRTDINAKKGN